MRYSILKIVLYSFLLMCNSYSQFYADSVISEPVIEFLKIADEEAKLLKETNSHEITREFSDSEIEDIARLYYKVFNEDPVGYNIYLEKLHKKWELNRNSLELKPAMKLHLLVKKIAEKYGIPFTEIIGTPAFLRCKYMNLELSNYKIIDGSNNLNMKAHTFNFVVEDILKGHKFFKTGDTIAIMMIGGVESPLPVLSGGNIYFIPLGTLSGLGKDGFNIKFQSLKDKYDVWKMGEPPRVFPIENETIKNCEYFGFPEMDWNKFKVYFKEKFLIFK
jgi:hypothetical protein